MSLRAVIYNRCSTEEEAQKDALAKQVRESRACAAREGWELVDFYVEARSGTTSKGRSEYNRLYQDLESDKFDIIVIKSQDRLMRNTKDWYLFLDRMQKNNKRLYMYLEGKFYTPDDALISGIRAILAEEYSRELSKKINNAHRNRQREGKSFVFTNRTYGYKKMPDKRVVIDEAEAGMIRMIFELSAGGYGTHSAAEILYQNGYRNHQGRKLGPSLIRNIIRNPIYKGTVVQNRQHYDFESKRVCKNLPSEWILHENVLPPIVDGELFERANRGLDQRRQEKNRDGVSVKGGRPGKYDLSGKLVCGLCGSPFYRVTRRNKSGGVTEWKCSNYLQNGRRDPCMRRDGIRKTQKEEGRGCDNVHLEEGRLLAMLEQLYTEQEQETRRDRLLRETLTILQKALGGDDSYSGEHRLKKARDQITRQKRILLDKLLEGVIPDADFRMKNEELNSAEARLEEQRQMESDVCHNGGPQRRMETIRERLEAGVIRQAQTGEMMEAISRIRVFPDYMEVSFEPGARMGIGDVRDLSAPGTEGDAPAPLRLPWTRDAIRRRGTKTERGS